MIPKDTKLPPWPKDVLKEWDQLTDGEKKLFIRHVEVFAAYAAYNDHEIGRVIQAFEDPGHAGHLYQRRQRHQRRGRTDGCAERGRVFQRHQRPDLAAENPQNELKQMSVAEARKYQVFPLDTSVAARIVAPRPDITAGRTEFVYTRPMTGLPTPFAASPKTSSSVR